MQPSLSPSKVSGLLAELKELRESCLAMEREFASSITEACPQSRRSVQNLVHYLALRKRDLRDLQSRLASLGLSSLGRSESSVMAGLEAVIAVLESLAGERCLRRRRQQSNSVNFATGSSLLAEHANDLLGPIPKGRAGRIMVTMPSEAAQSYDLVKGLVDAGMDVMRLNCAHDGEREWECMITHMRRANQESGKHCKVLMDLGGPKLRTGSIQLGHRVVRWKVVKDARGTVVAPARIRLWSLNTRSSESAPSADTPLPVPATLLRSFASAILSGSRIAARGSGELTVVEKTDHACICSCQHSAYVLSRAEWSLVRDGEEIAAGRMSATFHSSRNRFACTRVTCSS